MSAILEKALFYQGSITDTAKIVQSGQIPLLNPYVWGKYHEHCFFIMYVALISFILKCVPLISFIGK